MIVNYFHEFEHAYGNIIWKGKFPMRGGMFPANHPCSPSNKKDATPLEFGTSEALTKFRERGYYASCFPEGDGISMKCGNGQDAKQAAADIKDCFGWEVFIARD